LEGLPAFSVIGWCIVLWLAVINTAFAYLLYNHSLQVLTALEMNVLLNLSPLGTPVLACLLLDENLSIIQIIGHVHRNHRSGARPERGLISSDWEQDRIFKWGSRSSGWVSKGGFAHCDHLKPSEPIPERINPFNK
jgi:hypothetical protein